MATQKYIGIGMMSGTSLDGLDIAQCEFQLENKRVTDYRIIEAKTIDYPSTLRALLSNPHLLDGQGLTKLDLDLGNWMGIQCKNFISDLNQKPTFIASHGHTIFHQPKKQLTLQIGNGNCIYSQTSIPVIFDFRSLDVALGGQGAPLVPIGDQHLFGNFQLCVNLGGFANISYDDSGIRKAFDSCPVNIILNNLTLKLGHRFDEGGKIAFSGKIIPELLEKLNSLEYYQHPSPKSLGKEWVEINITPTISEALLMNSIEDVIHTCSMHSAQIISNDINRLCLATFGDQHSMVLITGGGAFNKFILDNVRNAILPNASLVIPEKQLIEFKEAVVFAMMGLFRLKGWENCLSSVTGASIDSCGGTLVG